MEIRVYEYTAEGITPMAVTETFESLNFREDAFRYGSFRLTIPTDYPEINEFRKNRLVLFDKYYCGIITGINHDIAESGEITEISGIEAKGLLSYRITIPPGFTAIQGLAGYDAVTGDTETCIKRFWTNNIGSGANERRRLKRSVIAPNLNRGTQNDKYMTRYDDLSEVTGELAEDSKLVITAGLDVLNGVIVFDVREPVDRTSENTKNEPAVLSVDRNTVLQMRYAEDLSNSRNIFYTTRSGAQFADEALTVMFTRENEAEASDIFRREQHLNVSVKTPVAGQEYTDMRLQALHEMTNYEEAQSLTAEINYMQLQYRRDYNLGDMVTAYNREWNVTTDVQITAVERNLQGSSDNTVITLGTKKKGIVRQILTAVNNI